MTPIPTRPVNILPGKNGQDNAVCYAEFHRRGHKQQMKQVPLLKQTKEKEIGIRIKGRLS